MQVRVLDKVHLEVNAISQLDANALQRYGLQCYMPSPQLVALRV